MSLRDPALDAAYPESDRARAEPTDPRTEVNEARSSQGAAPHLDEAPTPEAVAAFLVRLGKALHTYGTPSHRTEDALTRVARRLGVRGQFLVTPTSILGSFGEDEAQITRLARVDAGETDLQKLTRLHQIIRDVFDGTIGVPEASAAVDEVQAAPPAYGRLLAWLAFAATSAAAARFFDGGTSEILSAAGAGAAIGLLNTVGSDRPRLARLLPVLSGMIAALTAGGLAVAHGVFAPIVVLASLIVLLPGLTLTVAMNELALNHVVSGTARMTAATVTFLELAFGVALGTEIARRVAGTVTVPSIPSHLPEWTLAPALVVVALSLTVLFRARIRDAALILLMATIAFATSRLGTDAFGPELGAALGALGLGVAANAASRWLDQPTAIALLPALLLLVPGSLGFRSLQALMADDVVAGIESLFTMALVAIALVSGLLVANLLVIPRRLL